ncbi:MAG: [citrate (pro-3S)-lyase] ligase, partial [Hungatella sp.]
MPEYHISRIRFTDQRALKELDTLLEQEGIERDKNLDYTVGLYDEDYHLAASGSCFLNTLRCLAVDSKHQGEGLLNQVISHLIDVQIHRNRRDLFLYTKCNTAGFFSDLGFYEIARVDGQVVFMENRRTGFADYLAHLQAESAAAIAALSKLPTHPSSVGAVILNANPFTLGHQYLLETAAAACDLLHVFVVSEDVSLFPFSVRSQLVEKGSAHLKNVLYHQTGNYMISNATFPSYFLKDSDIVIRSHAKLDIEVFKQIARSLGITDRFIGEEPFSQVTGIYNQVMEEELAQDPIRCHILPRKADASGVISASKVREWIHLGQWDFLQSVVPESTYHYL